MKLGSVEHAGYFAANVDNYLSDNHPDIRSVRVVFEADTGYGSYRFKVGSAVVYLNIRKIEVGSERQAMRVAQVANSLYRQITRLVNE